MDALLHRLDYFISLSKEDKERLKDAVVRVEEVEKDQVIISEKERPEYVHLMVEGWACRYKYVRQGKRSIMAYLIPGDLCDVHITLLDHMDHSVSTLTPARIALIPRERVNRIFENHTSLAYALFWASLVEESTLREWFVNTTSRPADQRLAHIFCEMYFRSRAAGVARGGTIDLPLTQHELADAMGITVVHTNRILQKLRKDRMITLNNGRLDILDWERLKHFGEFDPGYLHLSEDILASF